MNTHSDDEMRPQTPFTFGEYVKQFNVSHFFYGNAAHAFFDVMVGLQEHRPKKKPNIVMPVYIPAKLYRFVLAAGYEPKFYDVPTNLDIDLEDIERLMDDQTQAVFAVHFFGVPVDLHPLKQLTKHAGIALIEDCAHTIHSSYKGTKLGTTGDFTLFSTRKMMQLHCGGLLLVNTPLWDFEPSGKHRVSSFFTAYHLAGSRLKYAIRSLLKGYDPFQRSTLSYNGYINTSENQVVNVKKMDYLFEGYCKLQELNTLVNKRRKNFRFLLNGIRDHSMVTPLGMDRYAQLTDSNTYSLNKGFTPFSLPVLTPPDSRDRIQQTLQDAGVQCYKGWPEAPYGKERFIQAEKLKHGLLELPVHSFIHPFQLQTIVRCINTFSHY